MGYRRVILVLTLVLCAGVLFYYLNTDFGSVDQPGDDIEVAHVLEEFELVENVAPDKRWVLFSPRAHRSDNQVNLQNPEIKYIEGDKNLAEIYAREGRYDLAGEHLWLKGEVIIKRPHLSQELYTDQLKWDGQTGIISTEAALRFEFREGILTARGLRMDLEEERLELKSEVEFQVH